MFATAARVAALGWMVAMALCGCKAADTADGTTHESGGAMVVPDAGNSGASSMGAPPTEQDASPAPATGAGGDAGQVPDAHDAGTETARDASVVLDAEPAAIDCDAFPDFDRSCDSANDCAVVTRQIDCCGGMIATGVRVEEAVRFASAAAECAAKFPSCDCAAGPTSADDGTTGAEGTDASAACVGGSCATTFSSALEPCGPNGLGCDAATEICVAREPVGPAIVFECKKLPAECQSDRSCACLASSLCAPPYDTCFDDDPAVLRCVCPLCQ